MTGRNAETTLTGASLRRVMIVDDMLDFGRGISEILTLEGYLTTVAASAREANVRLASFVPEVILMDIRLNGTNGIDLMVQLKAGRPDIQVIIMTAHATVETAINALKLGAYGYLRKPLEEEELLITLDRCFETIHLKRHKEQAEAELRCQKEQLQALNHRLRQVVDSAQHVVSASNTDRFSIVLLEQFAACLRAEGGSYYEVQDNCLKKTCALGGDDTPALMGLPFAQGCAFESCLRRKAPLLIHDIRLHPEPIVADWPGYREGSALVFPLFDENGITKALIALHNRTSPPFTGQDLELGALLASHCRETRRAISAVCHQRKSESEYERLFNNLPDIYFRINQSGIITLISPSVFKILGFTPDELIGQSIGEFFLDSDGTDFIVNAIQTEAIPERLENYSRAKDGSHRWMSVSLQYIRDDNGNVIGLEGTSRDETLMKKNEEERQRLAAAVEQTTEMVVITDISGNVRYVNPSFERITGFTSEDTLGRSFRKFQATGSAGQGQLERSWEAAKRGEVGRCTITNRKKDGTLYEEEVTISPIRNDAGKIINFLALKRDITIEKTITEQLVHAHKMEAVGALAGGIAHDFNNILCGIIGYTDLSLMLVKEEGELHGYLNRVITAGRRASDLIRQILAISRKDVQSRETFQLESLVREVLKLLRATLPSTIEIRKNSTALSTTVDADASKIHQVLMNLAINAAHAMGNAGGVLSVNLESIHIDPETVHLYLGLTAGRYLHLSVGDTGEGISPDIRERIFEPFFTTKPEGVGTGMGLSIAHGIITNHGGTIKVDSEVGKGSIFHVFLPQIDSETINLEKTPRFDGKIGMGQHILIVDDEPFVADIGGKLLTQLGFRVTIENNSTAALEKFQNDPDGYALIITDQTMPGMTGLLLTEKIRNICHTVPVILCSGGKFAQTDEVYRRLGINSIMRKPFDSLELARNVAAALSLPGWQD